MKVNSNILGVIGQLERLQRNIPQAVADGLAPELWEDEARDVARAICLALAQGAERAAVPAFVATVMALVLSSAGGLLLSANSPESGVQSLGAAAAAQGARSNRDLGLGLFDRPVSEFEELMTRWVAEEKDKDKRDYGKSDEEIGRWIAYLLLTPEGKLSAAEKHARDGFMRHIPQWLAKQQGSGVSEETADLWLRSVLVGWRKMVRVGYPGKVRAILREMATEL